VRERERRAGEQGSRGAGGAQGKWGNGGMEKTREMEVENQFSREVKQLRWL
jgi:hypothetical protein